MLRITSVIDSEVVALFISVSVRIYYLVLLLMCGLSLLNIYQLGISYCVLSSQCIGGLLWVIKADVKACSDRLYVIIKDLVIQLRDLVSAFWDALFRVCG